LCPLRESPVQVEDFRRTRGRRHSVPSVVGVIVATRLAGIHDGIGADRFGRALGRRRPATLGAWRNPGTGRYVPPSKSVPCRVLDGTERWAVPRLLLGAAIAADGKRIRGANRSGDGRHETATPVARDTGLPVAGPGFNDEGGERAAVQALPERFPSRDGSSPSMRCTRPGTPPAASSGRTEPTGS